MNCKYGIVLTIVAILFGCIGWFSATSHAAQQWETVVATSQQSALYWKDKAQTWLTAESDYIDIPSIEEESWKEKYNDLQEAYRHTVWHYDAQADNLRQERDSYLQILKDIGYYQCVDNFTIESDNFTIQGEVWEAK